jgi:hypothetical protein
MMKMRQINVSSDVTISIKYILYMSFPTYDSNAFLKVSLQVEASCVENQLDVIN